MNRVCRTLLVIGMAVVGVPGHGQMFYYVEAGFAACSVPPMPTTAAPKAVSRGIAVPGRIHVSCGFDQGSYTVTLMRPGTAIPRDTAFGAAVVGIGGTEQAAKPAST